MHAQWRKCQPQSRRLHRAAYCKLRSFRSRLEGLYEADQERESPVKTLARWKENQPIQVQLLSHIYICLMRKFIMLENVCP